MDTEKEQETAGRVAEEGGEADILRSRNEALASEVKARGAAIIQLEQALAAKESEIAALKEQLEGLKQSLDDTAKAISEAAAAYKEMVVEANPGILPELITGATIEEIRRSLKNARAIMDRVRQEMEAAAAKTRIPAGSPQRTPLDLSGLSSREKIQQGLGG